MTSAHRIQKENITANALLFTAKSVFPTNVKFDDFDIYFTLYWTFYWKLYWKQTDFAFSYAIYDTYVKQGWFVDIHLKTLGACNFLLVQKTSITSIIIWKHLQVSHFPE